MENLDLFFRKATQSSSIYMVKIKEKKEYN